MKENQLVMQAHAIPIDKSTKRGWGRVELPADASAANNVFHFVFDEPPPLHSVIVSDDEARGRPVQGRALGRGRSVAEIRRDGAQRAARGGNSVGRHRADRLAGAAAESRRCPSPRSCRTTPQPVARFSFFRPNRRMKRSSSVCGWGRWETGADDKPQPSNGGATTRTCSRTRATARRCRSARSKSCGAAASSATAFRWRALRGGAAAHASVVVRTRERLFSRHAARAAAHRVWRAMAW